jgi:hypothetical protein
VPFLGTLLVFNKYVVGVLTLSPELVMRLFPHATLDINTAAQYLTLSRLYYLYFGLSFLGVASALFALLCPLDIKLHSSVRPYLEAESPLVTKARMGIVVPQVARSFVSWFGDYPEGSTLSRQVGQPDHFYSMFKQVITEMYVVLPEDKKPPDLPKSTEYETTFAGPFTDHRGAPDPVKIADGLTSGQIALIGFVYSFQELATQAPFRNDVLTLQYLALDHSRLWSRAIVIALYVLGFALLLIPTIGTFIRLAFNVITH